MICFSNFYRKVVADGQAAGRRLFLFLEATDLGGSTFTVLEYITGDFLWQDSGNEIQHTVYHTRCYPLLLLCYKAKHSLNLKKNLLRVPSEQIFS